MLKTRFFAKFRFDSAENEAANFIFWKVGNAALKKGSSPTLLLPDATRPASAANWRQGSVGYPLPGL